MCFTVSAGLGSQHTGGGNQGLRRPRSPLTVAPVLGPACTSQDSFSKGVECGGGGEAGCWGDQAFKKSEEEIVHKSLERVETYR